MGSSSSSPKKIDGILIKYNNPELNRLKIFGEKFLEIIKIIAKISVNEIE